MKGAFACGPQLSRAAESTESVDMSKALAAGVILITLVSPLAAQDGAKFPTGEDNPWPNGTSKTQIGKLTFENGYP